MSDNATTPEISVPRVAESNIEARIEDPISDQAGLEPKADQTVETIATPQINKEDIIDESTATSSTPFVVKPPPGDSKLILQNMEDVLNIVKKKHRQKHKRKKEKKRLAQLAEHEERDERAAMESAREESAAKGIERKQPLREKLTQENSQSKAKYKSRKSPLKCSNPVAENISIMKHFPRTPKHESPTEKVLRSADAEEIPKSPQGEKSPAISDASKPANVFHLMMNARNRSIGTNSIGQELSEANTSSATASAETLVKRKLVVQDSADRKGTKRKHEEEARADNVDRQFDRRSKRIKKMLTKPEEGAARKSNAKSGKSPTKELPQKRNRWPRRRRRPSSVTLVDSNAPTTSKAAKEAENATRAQDRETEELLAKLSSPTKKRDSLLGYFAKAVSPKEPATKMLTDKLPSEKSDETKLELILAQRASKLAIKIISPLAPTPKSILHGSAKVDVPDLTSTPSGRPRRSCAGKVRYNCDDDVSPKKLIKLQKQTVKTRASTAKQSADVSIEVIDLDNSAGTTSEACCTPQSSKKLAPLFVRQVPKPSPDPHTLRARAEFLRSGVPEKLKQEQVKRKEVEKHNESAHNYFPLIAHVQQLSADEAPVKMPRRFLKKFRLREEPDILLPVTTSAQKRRSKDQLTAITPGSITMCIHADYRLKYWPNSVADQPPLPEINETIAIIKVWKLDYMQFPTYKCFNQMREKYRYFSAQAAEVSDSRGSLQNPAEQAPGEAPAAANDNVQPPLQARNGEVLFTEKYRPTTFKEVLMTRTPVMQLRNFLANWTKGSRADGAGNSSSRVNNRYSRNLDETFDFADDSNSAPSVCNTVVLLGPSSGGKTNAVHIVAKEMNFNILEVNAGMVRTGRKVIQELQEATQSHQIRKGGKPTQSKKLLKKSLKGVKAKRSKSLQMSSPGSESTTDPGQSARKSLILIEDADIVFEQVDNGFTDALYTLAASSKRPVVFVAIDPNCPHLQRFIQQNVIHFKHPNDLNVGRYLSLLALTEKCPVNLDELLALYVYNNRNLRKTLNELQFFIQSGGARKSACRLTPDTDRTSSVNTTSPSMPSASSNDGDDEAEEDELPDEQRILINAQQNLQEQEPELQNVNNGLNPAVDDCQPTRREPGEVGDNVLTKLFVHKTLFKFYSCDQNIDFRIPFPVDFQFLRMNLFELIRNAKNLETDSNEEKESLSSLSLSNSPRKSWMDSITSVAEATSTTDDRKPLDELCDFYQNLSVAALLDDCAQRSSEDRVVPNLSEELAHTLAERSVAINLGSQTTVLDYFEKPDETPTICLDFTDHVWSSSSSRAMDYEPALRAICRTEKLRANAFRRKSRFYHYLRNYTGNVNTGNVKNFSMKPFNAVCNVLRVRETSPLDVYDDDDDEET